MTRGRRNNVLASVIPSTVKLSRWRVTRIVNPLRIIIYFTSFSLDDDRFNNWTQGNTSGVRETSPSRTRLYRVYVIFISSQVWCLYESIPDVSGVCVYVCVFPVPVGKEKRVRSCELGFSSSRPLVRAATVSPPPRPLAKQKQRCQQQQQQE